MKINVLTYHKGFVECDIPEDFVFLRVTQMTGDEIVEVFCYDEEWGDPYLYDTLDPDYENRTRDFFDCTYIVTPDQLESWNNRRESYHIFGKKNFEKSVIAYIDEAYIHEREA